MEEALVSLLDDPCQRLEGNVELLVLLDFSMALNAINYGVLPGQFSKLDLKALFYRGPCLFWPVDSRRWYWETPSPWSVLSPKIFIICMKLLVEISQGPKLGVRG